MSDETKKHPHTPVENPSCEVVVARALRPETLRRAMAVCVSGERALPLVVVEPLPPEWVKERGGFRDLTVPRPAPRTPLPRCAVDGCRMWVWNSGVYAGFVPLSEQCWWHAHGKDVPA